MRRFLLAEPMPRPASLTAVSLLVLSILFFCAACSAAPEPVETPLPTQTAAVTPESTAAPEPTPEPTPSPTPEPAFVNAALDAPLFARGGVAITATGIRFSANYAAYIDLAIDNNSGSAFTLRLDGLYLNGWRVDGAVMDGENVQRGESRAASIAVLWNDDPTAVYMDISRIASFECSLSLLDPDNGKTLNARGGVTVEVPDAEPMPGPAEGLQAVYEDNNMIVYLQGIDQSLQNVRAVLYKKPKATWKSVTIDPVYAGYTHMLNNTYALDADKYQLLILDGTDVFESRGITSLSELDLYISMNMADGRQYRPVIAKILDPNVSETIASAPDLGPVVYRTELEYCILRYMGITQYDGHEAILLDFENISQNYKKKLDMTATVSDKNMTLDGVQYPLGIFVTYAFPTTHGSILLWPVGAPEGTLSAAGSAVVRLKIDRINGGRYDPIADTGEFTIDLKAK